MSVPMDHGFPFRTVTGQPRLPDLQVSSGGEHHMSKLAGAMRNSSRKPSVPQEICVFGFIREQSLATAEFTEASSLNQDVWKPPDLVGM